MNFVVWLFGVTQLFVWLPQFFVSVSTAAGKICWCACGDFCFVSLLPFWGEIVELVALSFLFRVGLAQFFVGTSIN